MDAKRLKKWIDSTADSRQLRHNLYMRSLGEPASSFNWSNPEEADGVPILARSKVSDSDPNIKTAFDNFSLIQTTKSGYLANIKRVYSDNVGDDVKDKFKEFDKRNSVDDLYSNLMESDAGWGTTYTVCVVNESGLVDIHQANSWNASVMYANGQPVYGYVIHGSGDEKEVWVYDSVNVTKYSLENGKVTPKENAKPHLFGFMPVVEWKNNENRRGNAQKAVGLMDAYDRLISDNVTEFSSFRNAYLLLKDMGVIDDKVKAEMQKTGVFVGTGDAKAEFITKNINSDFARLVIDEAWSGIWVASSSVDPKALSTLSNATAFQISQLFRIAEADAKVTERCWRKSLELLDKILHSYWTTADKQNISDFSTLDVDYEFKRNTPKDEINMLESLERAGVDLPQWRRIMIALGVDEVMARELAEEGLQENTAMLPSFDE